MKNATIANPILKVVFIITLWAGVHIQSYGQNMDSIRNELQKVSLQLYTGHNRNFLIVDAILDGLIKINPNANVTSSTTINSNGKSTTYNDQPDETKQIFSYMFVYQDGAIKINGKPLNDMENIIYRNKVNNFYSHGNDTVPNNFTITNYFLNLKDIFTPYSSFRKGQTSNTDQTLNNIDAFSDRSIVNMLVDDKLLDTSGEYLVMYTSQGLFVQNTRLPNEAATKYILYINSKGFTAQSPTDQMHIDKNNIRCKKGTVNNKMR